MGYYTAYTLTIYEGEGVGALEEKQVISEFRNSCEGAAYSLGVLGQTEERSKWYDHEEDLKQFSRSYPNYVFCLEGEGEEAGDLWKLYVKNGKSQRANAQIVFDAFDKSLLN